TQRSFRDARARESSCTAGRSARQPVRRHRTSGKSATLATKKRMTSQSRSWFWVMGSRCWFQVPVPGSSFHVRSNPEPEPSTQNQEPGTPFLSGPERAATPAGALRVRVIEDESAADETRVVIEDGAVQIQQALLVDKNLRAIGTFKDFIAKAGFALPRKRVTQAGTASALHPDTQTALIDALLGH